LGKRVDIGTLGGNVCCVTGPPPSITTAFFFFLGFFFFFFLVAGVSMSESVPEIIFQQSSQTCSVSSIPSFNYFIARTLVDIITSL